jgi:hypothetical protein
MKKLTITTLLFFVMIVTAIGQNRKIARTYIIENRTYYHRNPFDKTFTKVQQSPGFGVDSLALKSYFVNQLKKQISQTEGQIKVGLLIDSTGKPLCEWIENLSNFNLQQDKLNLVIDEMPNWNAGILAKRRVNCALTLVLTFGQQNLSVLSRYRIGGE